jgi:hypothetical protein
VSEVLQIFNLCVQGWGGGNMRTCVLHVYVYVCVCVCVRVCARVCVCVCTRAHRSRTSA